MIETFSSTYGGGWLRSAYLGHNPLTQQQLLLQIWRTRNVQAMVCMYSTICMYRKCTNKLYSVNTYIMGYKVVDLSNSWCVVFCLMLCIICSVWAFPRLYLPIPPPLSSCSIIVIVTNTVLLSTLGYVIFANMYLVCWQLCMWIQLYWTTVTGKAEFNAKLYYTCCSYSTIASYIHVTVAWRRSKYL